MQRCHPVPFGVEVRYKRCVRFRLWTPLANRLDLCLERDAPEIIRSIVGELKGRFSLMTDQAAPGSRFRYRINGGLRVPDPSSRFQSEDVHDPSQIVDPRDWQWTDVGGGAGPGPSPSNPAWQVA
jgi:maltooligosyltrehalose trehalohydrolase